MRFKEIATFTLAALVCVGFGLASTPATAGGNPATSTADGVGTYIGNVPGLPPFENQFDFSGRNQHGKGKGKGSVATPLVSFQGDFKFACVEIDGDTSIFVGVFKRGTAGLLSPALFAKDDLKGVAFANAVQDRSDDGDPGLVSTTFFWDADEVPNDPCDLLDVAVTGTGLTVREFLAAQLVSGGANVLTSGDIEVCDND